MKSQSLIENERKTERTRRRSQTMTQLGLSVERVGTGITLGIAVDMVECSMTCQRNSTLNTNRNTMDLRSQTKANMMMMTSHIEAMNTTIK